jgi:hypothetical protein
MPAGWNKVAYPPRRVPGAQPARDDFRDDFIAFPGRPSLPKVSRHAPFDPKRVRKRLAPCPEIDCVRHLLSPGVLAGAELRATEVGTGADRVLVTSGSLTEDDYARALAASLGLRFDASGCRETASHSLPSPRSISLPAA